MEKINVAELLKDCPKGMELDCTMFEGVVFHDIVNRHFPIRVRREQGGLIELTANGCIKDKIDAKCVIFPKGKTTWEGFQRPFKDGDIVVNNSSKHRRPFIYKGKNKDYYECHVGLTIGFNLIKGSSTWIDISCELRPATEKEIVELFQAIKDNGYKWNPETNTLEKLIVPKFKVGDKVRHKTYTEERNIVTEIKDTHYILDDELALPFISQDDYELVPNKFDINTLVAFESKVLVRYNRDNKWCASFFSHLDEDFHSHCYKFVTISGKSYPMCIPYEGNEHLLGTTNDCDEFYKTWK